MLEESRESSRESEKNVSDKFLDLIFESLQNLQDFETCMNRGCSNLIDFMREFNINYQDPLRMNYIKVENVMLMVHEFNKLFTNIKSIVDKTKMEKMEEKLKKIKGEIENGIYSAKEKTMFIAFKETINQKLKTRGMTIYPLFDLISKELLGLRGDVVSSLNHILFSQKQENLSGKQIY